ncbi:MAG: hypothetical protein H6713_24425 [Myxococcales bacterium]|nr:hypothetical protein [Myxococcales bacterium]
MEAFFSARSPEELEAARAAMATRDLAPLDASARERDAWTLLRLPTPLLHPGLAAAAATRLGIARASALQLARCELVRVGARALEPVPDAQQRAEDNARRLARLDPETRSRALRSEPLTRRSTTRACSRSRRGSIAVDPARSPTGSARTVGRS